MIIKKFTGKTENEALEAARKELGDGLVVMNIKDVKPKGLFAFLKKRQIEVTVALEEEGDQTIKLKKDIRDAVQSVKTIADSSGRTVASGLASSGGSFGLAGGIDSGNIEKKLDSLQLLLERQLNREEARPAAGEAAGEEVKKHSEENPSDEAASKEDTEQEKFFKLLYNTLIENEVDEKYANQIIEDMGKSSKPNIPFDYILSGIYQKLVLKFGKGDGIVPAEKGPKAVFFMGPTGVGKTTTIAKIASSFVIEEKKKVALLTTDTYRIAAAEQLHTYANILEVPFRIIYTADELAEAISDFKDYDYIFVDTAGHSHQNEEQMTKLRELYDTAEKICDYQAFLVLSTTTKYKDLLKIAESYGAVTECQLIFTKLDETTTLGNMINVRLYMDTPIAYVTYGQNVPDDIEYFNPQNIVKQILGGKNL